MTHSFILLNDGSDLLLNDGSKVLLNEAGPEHDEGSSGGGIFRRFKRQIYKQPEKKDQITLEDWSRIILSRPFLIQDFAKAIILFPKIKQNINILAARIKLKPNAIIHLILQALTRQSHVSFTINEPASQWIKSGLDDEDREKSFEHSSSFVGTVTYFSDDSTMTIMLNGKLYGFCNVSERIYTSFEGSPSKGEYFSRNIRGQYSC